MAKKKEKYIGLADFLREVSAPIRIDFKSYNKHWKSGYTLKGNWTTSRGPYFEQYALFQNTDDASWFAFNAELN